MTLIRAGTGASAEARFRDLFARHHASVAAYAARRVGRDEAADAAAEVFTVAWRRLHRVPPEPETLPWLYGVARKVVSNLQRSRRRSERLAARQAAHTGTRGAQPPPVVVALNGLSRDDREILMLAAWEGLGPAEIGAILGCSRNAASVRLHRARSRLAGVLGEEMI
jgi:RNA polymerase sigma-70 factor (ECF subfamily)